MIDANLENLEYARNSETKAHSSKNVNGTKSDDNMDESDHGSSDLDKTKRSMNLMKNTCTSCVSLKKHMNSPIKEFIWDLGAFFGMDLKSSMPRKSIGSKMKILSALPVAENQKKVEVTFGSGLWISKAAKSKILITCDNDPYKLTRQIIQELYGKDVLRHPNVTAMGHGVGGRGIGIENLEAIYKFVKRNTPWDCPPPTQNNKKRPKLSFALFTREVNRKIISLRRTSINHIDSEEETTQGVQDSSVFTLFGNKGSKRSATQESTATDVSLPCSTPKKRCTPQGTSTQRNSSTPVKTTTSQKTPPKTPRKNPNNAKNGWVVTPLKQNNTTDIQTTQPHDASLTSHQDSLTENLSENYNLPSTQSHPTYSHQPNINYPYQHNHTHSYPYLQQGVMTPHSFPNQLQYPVYNYPPQQHYQINPANSSNQAHQEQYPTNLFNHPYNQHEKENSPASYTQL